MSIPYASEVQELLAAVWPPNQLTPEQLVIGLVVTVFAVGIVTLLTSVRRRRKQIEQAKTNRLIPAIAFLKLLSADSTQGAAKRFIGCFHATIQVSPGVLMAMRRCVMKELGACGAVDSKHAEFTTSNTKKFGQVTVAKFRATFANRKDVPCEVSWTMVRKSDAPSGTKPTFKITHFHVDPQNSLNVTSFIDPRDFTDEGEKFIASAFSNHPTVAQSMLGPTLKRKYATDGDLNREMVNVVRAMGGLKDKTLEVDNLSALVETVQDKSA